MLSFEGLVAQMVESLNRQEATASTRQKSSPVHPQNVSTQHNAILRKSQGLPKYFPFGCPILFAHSVRTSYSTWSNKVFLYMIGLYVVALDLGIKLILVVCLNL